MRNVAFNVTQGYAIRIVLKKVGVLKKSVRVLKKSVRVLKISVGVLGRIRGTFEIFRGTFGSRSWEFWVAFVALTEQSVTP